MRVIIDFDYTLFDTDAMRGALLDALQQFGVSEEQYQSAEKELIAEQGRYSLKKHLDALLVGDERDKAGQAVDRVLENAEAFLYPDVQSFLKQFAVEQVTILTFGTPAWQQQKIKGAGLDKRASEIIATLGDKKDILADIQDDQVVVIDDKGSEIDAMKKVQPNFIYIWIRRQGARYYDEPCISADFEVNDLSFNMNELIESK